MSMISKIFSTVLEWQGRKYDYAGWKMALEKDGVRLAEQFATAADSEKNRRILSHIIGIERWAQSRLRVTLGEPFKQEEYDVYRPSKDTTWETLRQQFSAVRADSAEIAQQLITNNVPLTKKVMHNQMGDLSPRAWLRYIFMHSKFEGHNIK